MKKRMYLTTVLAGILGICNAQNNSVSLRESLLDPDNGEIFVIAHRGDWHGTAENSLHAIRKAVEKGAKIAQVDLQRTRDGQLVLFSDATVERITTGTGLTGGLTLEELRALPSRQEIHPDADSSLTGIATWKEALAFAKGRILLEIEPGEYLEQAVREAREAGSADGIIVSGNRAPEPDILYIPTVSLDEDDALQQLSACLESNPAAIELRYRDDDNALTADALEMLRGRCRICMNTCAPGLAGSHADTGRGDDPDRVWGSLIRRGVSLFVSDQIKPLLRYLNGEQQGNRHQGTPEGFRRNDPATGGHDDAPEGFRRNGPAAGGHDDAHEGFRRNDPAAGGHDDVHEGFRRNGPAAGGQFSKREDPAVTAMIEEVLDKFVQAEYQDAETGHTMAYNLFIPEDYDAGQSYPLLLFIGDASTVSPDVTRPLTQGYGGLIWATAGEQAKHPCFVLVPQYTTVTVNDNFETSYEVEMTLRLLESLIGQYSIDTSRLYTTGQSMGGMMSMYFNVAHPDLFAASLYAGCQWDTSKMAHFANQKFFYVVAGGDPKASKGMAELKAVLAREQASASAGEWSAKLPREEQDARVCELIGEGNRNNFITFTPKSVLNEDGSGHEHMSSFDYVYKLEKVRDWLFEQKKEQ